MKHLNTPPAIFWITLITVLATPAATAQPELEVVGGTKIALDTLYRGEVVERMVTLKNVGKETLLIGDVTASCGCTGTVVSTDRLAPGASGTLKVTFNAKSVGGPVKKTIAVRSNDPQHPVTTLELTALVVQEIEVLPQSFWFKDAEVGRASSVTVTLRNGGKSPVKLISSRTDLEGLTVSLPAGEVPPGTEVKLTATLKAAREMSVISDAVHIETSNPRHPEVYIPVFGAAKTFKFN
jgi:hypothetical protein